MTPAPEQAIPWRMVVMETAKAAPTIVKILFPVLVALGMGLSFVGVKVVSVPGMEISRLSAQGMVFDTAIKSIRSDVNGVKWELTTLRAQVQDAQRPVLVDLCLTRTFDQLARMGLNCDSLGVRRGRP